MLELTDNPDIDANEYVVSKNAAEALHRHYPGWRWGVTCRGGMMILVNMLADANTGYYLKLSEVYGDPGMRCVIRAGGEMLERYRLNRGAVNYDHVNAAAKQPNGYLMFDPAGMKGRLPAWARPKQTIIKVSEWQNPQK